MAPRSMPLLLALAAGSAEIAQATPELALWIANDCQACHVAPAGWANPPLRERKCSLSCTGCHVDPAGGGLRNAGGLFYGRKVQPLWKKQLRALFPPDVTGGAEPGNPMAPREGVVDTGPKTAGRYDGIKPSPRFQFGGDFRAMAFWADLDAEGGDEDVVGETRVFPMQTDLDLLWHVWNPPEPNRGRLGLLATVGAVGQRYRGEDFAEEYEHSGRVKALYLLYDDLPYQAYLKAGRFYPAFGWKLDDHTSYVRQGQGFDHERWVEGIEVGLNPNYPFGHLSVYRFEPDKFTVPFFEQEDDGYGAALTGGLRHFIWHLGGSIMAERRKLNDDLWTGVSWGLNLGEANHPWKRGFAPVVYLGEIGLRRTSPDDGGEARDGIAVMNELSWFIRDGLRFMVRHDWHDVDRDRDDSERSRTTAGMMMQPLPYLEVIAQYRRNTGDLETGGFEAPNREREALLQVHLWF